MALTPNIQASQTYVFSLTGGETGNIQASQIFTNAIINYPTAEIQNSQSFVNVLSSGSTQDLQVSSSYITVVCRGRIDDPKIRVWTYTLDGHDYYILRLGSDETLVYDTYSGEWATWGSDTTDYWRAFQGINWRGSGSLSQEYGSNVVAGDDGNGALYFLNPDQYQDDDALEGASIPRNFTRELQGQMVKRGYDKQNIFYVELLGSIGKMDVPTLTDVTLYSSRDRGDTYVNHGTISIPNDSLDTRVDWRSLGSFTAPGVLFKIVDEGALERIDNLTVKDNTEES